MVSSGGLSWSCCLGLQQNQNREPFKGWCLLEEIYQLQIFLPFLSSLALIPSASPKDHLNAHTNMFIGFALEVQSSSMWDQFLSEGCPEAGVHKSSPQGLLTSHVFGIFLWFNYQATWLISSTLARWKKSWKRVGGPWVLKLLIPVLVVIPTLAFFPPQT